MVVVVVVVGVDVRGRRRWREEGGVLVGVVAGYGEAEQREREEESLLLFLAGKAIKVTESKHFFMGKSHLLCLPCCLLLLPCLEESAPAETPCFFLRTRVRKKSAQDGSFSTLAVYLACFPPPTVDDVGVLA